MDPDGANRLGYWRSAQLNRHSVEAVGRLAGLTLKLSRAWGAALKLVLPAWSAAMMQVPAVMPVTTLPSIEQMPSVVEANLTGFPVTPPVADTVPVPPTVTKDAAPKLIA